MLDQIPSGMTGFSGLLLITLLWLSMLTDLKTRKIPNRIVYPVGASVVGLNLIQAAGTLLGWNQIEHYFGGIGIEQSLLGGLVVFSGMFVLFLLGCGAGDVKLMTVLGAGLGFRTAAEVWFTSLLIAAVFVILLIVTRPVRRAASSLENSKSNPGGVPRRIPLAPFFLAGTVCVAAYPLIFDGIRLSGQLYSLL